MTIYDFNECVLLDNKGKNTVKVEPREISVGTFSSYYAPEIEIRGIVRDYDWKPPVRKRIDYNKIYGFWEMPKIKDVIFNDPATIVFWVDGTKTIVKCQDDDIFDPEKGLAMAISKKALGNKGNYCNEFKKWLPEEVKEEPVYFDAKELARRINAAARRLQMPNKEEIENA